MSEYHQFRLNKIPRLLGERILVKELEDVTPGGLILGVEESYRGSFRGLVKAVGSGRLNLETGERMPLEVEVGQICYFKKEGWMKVNCQGEDLWLIPWSSVLVLIV